ncbi:unnamed protein product [Rodentolepis nana]|uniref:Uncharacterized protein n=1 Tax=Rodentolepis nana TaxID=102285 RepID=A0A0R3TAP4_RODNA|nr:unnamed protein product [Rodentolepis nana]
MARWNLSNRLFASLNEGRTPPGDYGCFIPETPKDVYAQRDPPLLFKPGNVSAPGIGSITQPPQLPTQLLQKLSHSGGGGGV